MTEIVNLRQARKRMRRSEKERTASANRLAHGTPAAEKKKTDRFRVLDEKRFEGHRRETSGENE